MLMRARFGPCTLGLTHGPKRYLYFFSRAGGKDQSYEVKKTTFQLETSKLKSFPFGK